MGDYLKEVGIQTGEKYQKVGQMVGKLTKMQPVSHTLFRTSLVNVSCSYLHVVRFRMLGASYRDCFFLLVSVLKEIVF